MAKKANQFRNLRELEKYIANNVPDIIMRDRNVERVLKGTMQQSVYDVVYGHYIPHQYKRRGNNGGLRDTRTMEITEAIIKNGKFQMIFENLAEGSDTLKGQYLSDTIIEGIEDNWQKKGVWSEPRDFISETMNRILADPSHLINAVKKAFIKAGFKVK